MVLKKRPPRTWLEVAVVNAGLRDALRALNWAHSWAVVRLALDRDPSVEEVAEWWNMARRTAFRDQAAFRKAFPTLADPSPIYYASEQARAGLQAWVKLGKWADQKGEERRARREQSITSLGVGAVPPGFTG